MIDKLLALWGLLMSGWALINQIRVRSMKLEVAELKTEEKDVKIDSKVHNDSDDKLNAELSANLESKSDH